MSSMPKSTCFSCQPRLAIVLNVLSILTLYRDQPEQSVVEQNQEVQLVVHLPLLIQGLNVIMMKSKRHCRPSMAGIC
jgi:hypothetical protein